MVVGLYTSKQMTKGCKQDSISILHKRKLVSQSYDIQFQWIPFYVDPHDNNYMVEKLAKQVFEDIHIRNVSYVS